MQTTKQQTSKEYFQMLRILYYAFIFMQVGFAFIIFFLNQSREFTGGDDIRSAFIYIVPAVAIVALIGSNIIFKKRMEVCKSKTKLSEKMNDYRTSIIISYAILESASMLSIVIYFLTGDWAFLGSAGLVIAGFVLSNSSTAKAISDLELNPSEAALLNNPDAPIAEITLTSSIDDD